MDRRGLDRDSVIMTAWIKEVDMDSIPHDVLKGDAHVAFLELMRNMGSDCFAENDLFGTYVKTVNMLGEDCRYSRQLAKQVVEEDPILQKYLKDLKDKLEWMIIPT